MKLLLNRKPIDGPWGGGNLLVRALCDNAEANGFEVVHKFTPDLDAVLMLDPRPDELGIGAQQIFDHWRQHHTPVIHRVNECDARKGTTDMDQLLRNCSMFTRATIFVSDWMKDYHMARGWIAKENYPQCTSTMYVIYNGVDHQHFKPGAKLDNGKTNIVAHHWSNNPMKGFDIYDKLDEWVGENDDFTFTYIGRERGSFKNTRVVAPLHGQALGDELGRYDVYVTASRQDPGPNHVIEALACDLPTYAIRDGGGACEFVGVAGVYEDFDDLVSKLKTGDYDKAKVHGWPITWESCAERFFDVIRDTAEHTSKS